MCKNTQKTIIKSVSDHKIACISSKTTTFVLDLLMFAD